MWLKNFQFHSDNKWKCSFLSCLASEQIHNYTRNMKIMRTFFHCTVSQKEAIEINRFSDNSWMNWTFLYIGQEKTKVVGGRLVTVPAHKICTMAKLSKLCLKIMKAYFHCKNLFKKQCDLQRKIIFPLAPNIEHNARAKKLELKTDKC